MENVPGLARHPTFKDFIKTLTGLGYQVNRATTVHCEQYGVPQKRRRLVLLASRLGPISLQEGTEAPPTVEDCIHKLPAIEDGGECPDDPAHKAMRLSQKNRKRIAQSKPGGSWTDWDDDLVNDCHKKAHYPAPYGRMKWNALSPTITTQFCYYSTGRFGHPEQNRALSAREGALLQTFPRNYALVDPEEPATIRELARHVGNAVPVSLGTAIGVALREAANG